LFKILQYSEMECYCVRKNTEEFCREYVGLNSVHREILSSVIIVFYDKVRGRNKAQRWLHSVWWGFFIWKRYNRTQLHSTLLCLTSTVRYNIISMKVQHLTVSKVLYTPDGII